jgi:hypothetical protein
MPSPSRRRHAEVDKNMLTPGGERMAPNALHYPFRVRGNESKSIGIGPWRSTA